MFDPAVCVLCLIGPVMFALSFAFQRQDLRYQISLIATLLSTAMCLIVGVLGMLNMIFD